MLPLIVILAAAALVRQMFFVGPLGSDDVVYLARTIDVAEGLWTSTDYNGALRYGHNSPAGEFCALFWPGRKTAFGAARSLGRPHSFLRCSRFMVWAVTQFNQTRRLLS